MNIDKRAEQDRLKLLRTLQERGPQTTSEIAKATRLSTPRVSALLQKLKQQGFVHTPRCTQGKTGASHVNVWEALPINPS